MKPTDAQWAGIQKHFPNPKDVPARETFEVFPLTVADNTYNKSHKLKLSDNFLGEIANSFGEGRGLPIGAFHGKELIPAGRSFSGKYTPETGRVDIMAYFRDDGLEIGEGFRMKDIIESIRDGRQTDNSMELRADSYICSICGNDLRDFGECKHVPGKTYDGELCYATIDSGRVLNTKLVDAGSFINAKVIPHESPAGSHTNVTIPFPVAAGEDLEMDVDKFIKLKEEKLDMADKDKTPVAPGDVTQMFAELVKDQKDMVRQLSEKDVEIGKLKTEIESLKGEKEEEQKKFEEAKADMEKFEAEKAEYQSAVDALKNIVKELGVQVQKDKFDEESLKEITVGKLMELRESYVKELNEMDLGDVTPPGQEVDGARGTPASAFSLDVKEEER